MRDQSSQTPTSLEREAIRYRMVSQRTWSDGRFRELSAAKPNAQTLWLWCLTGPMTLVIPGALVTGQAGIAEALGWPVPATRRCWEEIEAQGMATADWAARLIWLPRALVHNPPRDIAQVRTWRNAFPQLPECALRQRIADDIVSCLELHGAEFLQPWLAPGDDPHLEQRLRRVFRERPELRIELQTRDQDRCRFCDRPVNWKDRRGPQAGTYEHVNPSGPSDLANLVVACRACASRKGRLTLEQAGMTLQPARLPGLDPDPDLGTDLDTDPGRSWTKEKEKDLDLDLEQDPGTYAAADAPASTRSAAHPSGRADGLKRMAWDQALAIAHKVIETCDPQGVPIPESDWVHEFRALCRDQRLDFSPIDSAGVSLDIRALNAAKAIRATRKSVFAEPARPVTGTRRPRVGAAS